MKHLLIIFMFCVLSEVVEQREFKLCLYRCENSDFFVDTIPNAESCDNDCEIEVRDE